MGRLIKKKPASKKKRSSSTVPGEDASQSTTAGGVKATVVEPRKKPAPAAQKTAGTVKTSARKGYIGQSVQFLREVKAELKKVTWPSRKQAIGSTVVVLVLVMIVAMFLGMADMGLSALARVVLQ
jgi:preprotein translocase subunit SecE